MRRPSGRVSSSHPPGQHRPAEGEARACGSQARARGLAAPYIAGGRDPQPEVGRREERFYLRILLIMVVLLVLSGFVIGAILKLAGA